MARCAYAYPLGSIYVDLTIEGIYRVSGQTSEVIFLKEKYDEGMYIHTY